MKYQTRREIENKANAGPIINAYEENKAYIVSRKYPLEHEPDGARDAYALGFTGQSPFEYFDAPPYRAARGKPVTPKREPPSMSNIRPRASSVSEDAIKLKRRKHSFSRLFMPKKRRRRMRRYTSSIMVADSDGYEIGESNRRRMSLFRSARALKQNPSL